MENVTARDPPRAASGAIWRERAAHFVAAPVVAAERLSSTYRVFRGKVRRDLGYQAIRPRPVRAALFRRRRRPEGQRGSGAARARAEDFRPERPAVPQGVN